MIFYQCLPFNLRKPDPVQSPLSMPHLFLPAFFQGAGSPSLSLLPKLEIDLSEILNALNDDQINVLSAFDPTTLLEASALFYKGFLIEGQLESR